MVDSADRDREQAASREWARCARPELELTRTPHALIVQVERQGASDFLPDQLVCLTVGLDGSVAIDVQIQGRVALHWVRLPS